MSNYSEQMAEQRKQIDFIDDLIVRLLLLRAPVSARIGQIKREHNKPVRDPERELLKQKSVMLRCPPDSSRLSVAFVFRAIMEASNIHQGGYQAPTGILHCKTCNVRTNGIHDPDFNWPICPACRMPLFP